MNYSSLFSCLFCNTKDIGILRVNVEIQTELKKIIRLLEDKIKMRHTSKIHSLKDDFIDIVDTLHVA